jgi:hypothetical protein
MQKRRLPRPIAREVMSLCYEKLTSHKDVDRIFGMLPSSLRIEVTMHTSLPLVKQTEVFSTCSSGFTASIAVLMRETVMAGDETLFRTNDVCNELYLIASGNLSIITRGQGVEVVRCGNDKNAVSGHAVAISACTGFMHVWF